jgi:hypothetical protein
MRQMSTAAACGEDLFHLSASVLISQDESGARKWNFHLSPTCPHAARAVDKGQENRRNPVIHRAYYINPLRFFLLLRRGIGPIRHASCVTVDFSCHDDYLGDAGPSGPWHFPSLTDLAPAPGADCA